MPVGVAARLRSRASRAGGAGVAINYRLPTFPSLSSACWQASRQINTTQPPQTRPSLLQITEAREKEGERRASEKGALPYKPLFK